MAKKRSVFEIEFDEDITSDDAGFPAGNRAASEAKSRGVQGHPVQNTEGPRRGPMASAIAEAADATTVRATAEAAIRAENDALAHEHVRLKKMGLITDLIQTSAVKLEKLTRDRSANVDPELEELIESIRHVGLSNPIRVEQTEDGYELIQGFRRLSAFRELEAQTGDPRYGRIPAVLVPRGEPLEDLYRKMVDENLVRKGVTFGEMAQLALTYAQDVGVTKAEAVATLYASALKQKRRYILQFVHVLDALCGALRHPEIMPRALGLDLYRIFEEEEEMAEEVAAKLRANVSRDADFELRVLKAVSMQKKAPKVPRPETVSKVTLRISRPEGDVRVSAQEGRIDIRLPRNISAIDRVALQSGVAALLEKLKP